MIRFKDDVKIFGIRPEIAMAIEVANGIYNQFGSDVTVTSVVDGTHSKTSLHYSGSAVDFRTRNLADHQVDTIVSWLKQFLTNEFDVVKERDHIHVEFQPKI